MAGESAIDLASSAMLTLSAAKGCGSSYIAPFSVAFSPFRVSRRYHRGFSLPCLFIAIRTSKKKEKAMRKSVVFLQSD